MSDLTERIIKLLDESDSDTREKLTAVMTAQIVVMEEYSTKHNLSLTEEMALDDDAKSAAETKAAGLLVQRKKELKK